MNPADGELRSDTNSCAECGITDGSRTCPETAPAGVVRAPRVVASGDLLCGEPELHILHAGSIYRLRVTQHGKLILCK